MESLLFLGLCLGLCALIIFVGRVLFLWFIVPNLALRKLKANGFSGPKPSFPTGNLNDMKRVKGINVNPSSNLFISNDIHSTAFPYFARWQKLHGKVFMYWIGTEAFVYIAEPEFLKVMSGKISGKAWGKPTVFKDDRDPMFGRGLVMVEGQDWVRHRHVITPAFTPANLKAMASLIVESTTKMVERWGNLIISGRLEIDVEKEIIRTSGEIIAKTAFGVSYENSSQVLEKLSEVHTTLFKSNRYVGVPFGKWLNPKLALKAKGIGKEIDGLLHSIIMERSNQTPSGKDLLGLLMGDNTVDGRKKSVLTTKELVDECKTFFFAGHETTALALTWTLLLLAIHPEWQKELREEIKRVVGDGDGDGDGGVIDATVLGGLKKMGWVMNEVLRLYPPAPNVQRQAREDIQVGNLVIPNGTNVWIDVVSMHHDEHLWGEDVHEFKPQRFDEGIYGGCNHKMGFLPFGFGGRMCVGRNLTTMEYKIVLTLILIRFSFSLSPKYCHEPTIMLSLRPMHGMPLIFKPI